MRSVSSSGPLPRRPASSRTQKSRSTWTGNLAATAALAIKSSAGISPSLRTSRRTSPKRAVKGAWRIFEARPLSANCRSAQRPHAVSTTLPAARCASGRACLKWGAIILYLARSDSVARGLCAAPKCNSLSKSSSSLLSASRSTSATSSSLSFLKSLARTTSHLATHLPVSRRSFPVGASREGSSPSAGPSSAVAVSVGGPTDCVGGLLSSGTFIYG